MVWLAELFRGYGGRTMTINGFQLMLLFWHLGLVDTFSFLQFCINSGSQYTAIVAASAVGNYSDIGPKVLLEPIRGIGTSFQFIRAAKTLADRRARIATLAAFLSTSASAAITTDPSTNFGVGSAVASKISYMRVILARGGSQPVVEYILVPGVKYFVTPESLAGPTVDPKRIIFSEKSRIIIENMFREHTSRRYTNGLARRVLEPTVLKLFY